MLNFCKRRRPRHLSRILPPRKELEPVIDVIDIFVDSEMDDYAECQGIEACMTEDNKFVGTTAKFIGEGMIQPLRPDLRPTG
jgi:hypothetical protein